MKDPSTTESPWSDPDPDSSDPGDPALQHAGNDEEQPQPQESSAEDAGSSDRNADPEDAEAGIHDLTRIANNIVDGCPEILDLAREHSPDSSALQGETSKMIGPYKVLEFISRGGFGDVYLCQETCKPHRKLAVKVIRAGLDTKDVLARFEAEKNALRLMNHPAISRIIDSGTTEDDHPYFAMEYIQGQTLTEFCSKEQLTLDERLRLFIDICSGVQHAHAKSVIHRDLKPSNIMVTRIDGVTRAKIIDFGLVKSLQQPLCDQTLHTRNGALVGTYEYMSPEQARSAGAEIDTRSDIYALGAILYQLLTGEMALGGLRKCSYAEALDRISREEPIRPSLRIRSDVESATSDHASTLKIGTEQLTQRLEVDLDWVVMKALEKEPERRYQTVQEFARDIENFLSGEMVEARPPSTSYRLNKFARRNRVVLTATALVFLALTAGITYVSNERNKVLIANAQESKQAERLEMMVKFHESRLDAIGTKDASEEGKKIRESRLQFTALNLIALKMSGERIKAHPSMIQLEQLSDAFWRDIYLTGQRHHVIDPTLEWLDRDLANEPIMRARLFQATVDAMVRSSELDGALQAQQTALELRRTHLGPTHSDTISSASNKANLLMIQGELSEAVTLFETTLDICRLALGNNDPTTIALMNNLGVALQESGELHRAETFIREAVECAKSELGSENRSTLEYEHNLGVLLMVLGDFDSAITIISKVLETQRRVLGDTDRSTIDSINVMGQLYRNKKQFELALPLCKEALDTSRRLMGDENVDTLNAINNMATILLELEEYDMAMSHFRLALDGFRSQFGAVDIQVAIVSSNMAQITMELKRYEEAEELLSNSVAVAKLALPEGHFLQGTFCVNHSEALGRLERFQEARDQALEGYHIFEASLGAADSRTTNAIDMLLWIYKSWNQAEPEAGHDKSAAEWQAKLDALTVAPTAK